MYRRVDLLRDDRRRLIRSEFIGVSGQVVSTKFEVFAPDLRVFVDRVEAERAYHQASQGQSGDAAFVASGAD